MIEFDSPQPSSPAVASLGVTGRIVHDYLSAVRFIIGDSARNPDFGLTHLLTYLSQDLIESAVGMAFLAGSGSLNVPKRELRFVIESSIKLCYVQQQNYRSSINEKLSQFDKELSSHKISMKRDLSLRMLAEPVQDDFEEELGRLYGETSTFVHWTPQQILQRIAAVDAGRTVGFESPVEIDTFNKLISRGFAASLVLLLHSVEGYVAGDFLVNSDGDTTESYFCGSRFIAAIDAFFDYKAERKAKLAAVQSARAARIRF
jgi:hypothetical protein